MLSGQGQGSHLTWNVGQNLNLQALVRYS
ncbi:hypothetical protein GPN2_11836 [Streptomyces murinus]